MWPKLRYLAQSLKWALHSLKRHLLRSALSILGIICGVVAVLVMIAIGQGAKTEALEQISQLGIRNIYLKNTTSGSSVAPITVPTDRPPLTVADARRILRQCPQVDKVAYTTPVVAGVMGLHQSIQPQVVAVSPDYAEILNIRPALGRFISDQDLTRRNLVCVVGQRLAALIGTGVQPGDHVRIGGLFYKVIGILDTAGRTPFKAAMPIAPLNYNDTLFIPFGTHPQPAVPLKNQTPSISTLPDAGRVSEIIARVTQIRQIDPAIRIIRQIIDTPHQRSTHYQLVAPTELLHQSQRTQQMFNIILGIIAGISLLVGGIGIANIMLANVSERVQEIGIRRAVGANRQHILIQFLGEAVLLTACGGTVGLLLGLGAIQAVATYSGWRLDLTWQAFLLPLAMALVTGLLAGVFPARRAAHLDPLAALRQA